MFSFYYNWINYIRLRYYLNYKLERRKSHKINFHSICVSMSTLSFIFDSFVIMQNWYRWCAMQAINIFMLWKTFVMLFLSKIDSFQLFYSTKWKCNDELWFMGYEIKCVALNKLSFYEIKISTTLLSFVVNIYQIWLIIFIRCFFFQRWLLAEMIILNKNTFYKTNEERETYNFN